MKKKNIAVIGCGDWGKNIARTLNEIDHLAAISDHHHSRYAADFSNQYNIPLLDFKEVLKDDTIEGIVIATPAETHYKIAFEALKNGKHVLVEKPLVKTLEEAESLKNFAIEQKKTLMVGHLLMYHPAFQELSRICHSGDIGGIKHIASSRKNFGKIYHKDSALWDLGPHDLSMVLKIAQSPIKEVFAVSRNLVFKNLNDIVTLHLTFKNDITAEINLSRLNPFKEQKISAIGEFGAVVFDDTKEWANKVITHKGTVEELDQEHVKTVPDFKGEASILKSEQPLKLELEHFVHCVATDSNPETPADEAIQIMEILMAADESIAKKKPITL